MATKLTKIVHNCETGVTEEVELTAEEIEQLDADRAAFVSEQAARDKAAADQAALKASAITKLVSGQALTKEEAALLIV